MSVLKNQLLGISHLGNRNGNLRIEKPEGGISISGNLNENHGIKRPEGESRYRETETGNLRIKKHEPGISESVLI